MVTMATNSIVTASVDVKALKHNVQRVREAAPGCRIMAVIKANAYGHGAIPVAQALQKAKVDAFAVARLEEALQLRNAEIDLPILCLEGVFDQQGLDTALEHQIQPVVHHLHQVSLFSNTKANRAQPVWLKIDSGMHRMGISPDVAGDVYQRLSQSPAVEKINLMTFSIGYGYHNLQLQK